MRDILDELLESGGFIHEYILDTDDINRQITMALYDGVNIKWNPYTPRMVLSSIMRKLVQRQDKKSVVRQ